MITLSFDEYGDFEGLEDRKSPALIAGVLFDDRTGADEKRKNNGESNERVTERARIKSYYRKVIKAAKAGNRQKGFRYPEALHVREENGTNNSGVVSVVKKKVRETLAEFLQFGTYEGKPLLYADEGPDKDIDLKGQPIPERKGKYYVFVILKSAAGISEYLKDQEISLRRTIMGATCTFIWWIS